MRKLIALPIILSIAGVLAGQWYAPNTLHNRWQPPRTLKGGGQLVAYWNAASLALADGANVTSVPDLSGNGNTATNGGVAPTFTANCLGGRPCINFVGASIQQLTAANSATLRLQAPLSIWAVVKVEASPTASNWILHKAASYAFGFGSTAKVLTFSALGVRSYDTAKYWGGSMGAALYGAEFVGAGSSYVAFYENSAAYKEKILSGTNTQLALNTNAVYIGSAAAGNYSTLKLAALLIYSGVMTTAERESFVQGMCGAYSLACPTYAADPEQAAGTYPASVLTLQGIDKSVATCPGASCVASNDVIQPGVTYVPGGFGGHPWWMIYTSYPGGAASKEANSIAYSDDGNTWSQCAYTDPACQMVNVCGAPTGTTTATYADPSLYYEAGTMYALAYETKGGVTSTVVSQSTDGVSWSACSTLLSGISNPVTPVIVKTAGGYEMYSTNKTTHVIYRRRSASLLSGWDASPVEAVVLLPSGTRAGPLPDHIDVKYENGLYYMLVYSSASGSPVGLAISQDGIRFHYQIMNTLSGSGPGGCASSYRSSLARVSPGVWDIWFSCAPPNPRIGHTTFAGTQWPF